jgi:hypothetical protein
MTLTKLLLRFDGKIAEVTGNVLPLSIFFHLLYGLWMYGNPSIFQSNSVFQDTLSAIDVSNTASSTLGKLSQLIKSQDTTIAFKTINNIVTNIPVMGLFFILYVTWVLWAYLLKEMLGPFLHVFFCCRKKRKTEDLITTTYFNSLPITFTKDALNDSTCKPELTQKYSASLGGRMVQVESKSNKGSVTMIGNPTFDINDNQMYRESFGFQYTAARNADFYRSFPHILKHHFKELKLKREMDKMNVANTYVTKFPDAADFIFQIFTSMRVEKKQNTAGADIVTPKVLIRACIHSLYIALISYVYII